MQNLFTTYTPRKQAEIAQKLFEMFPSSQRGHGWADPGARYFIEETGKWKFRPGGIGWKKEPVNVELWLRHLRGEMLLGLGPTLDDGTCFWGCIDIDHYGKDSRYDFNIVEIRSNAFGRYPKLIPIKSKSGGLRYVTRGFANRCRQHECRRH